MGKIQERTGAGVESLLQPVRWRGRSVEVLDQTQLPATHRVVSCSTVGDVAEAIRSMRVRGAPAIGVTAAYGYALAAVTSGQDEDLDSVLQAAASTLLTTRPTAVNLAWALDRMEATYRASRSESADTIRKRLMAEARSIHEESHAADRSLASLGADLLGDRTSILTHCNAGALATAGYGTAVGIIRRMAEQGKHVAAFACETRPFLQGSRLTAWELMALDIPVTVIADNMAGFLIQRGEVEAVVVGADRIAANGDTANKIGTYGLAVLAKTHDIPFVVAAPTSTVDLSTQTGADIPIEERDPADVVVFRGARVAPEGVAARHPAFDVTPGRYITAIVTEAGIAREPFALSLASLQGRASRHV